MFEVFCCPSTTTKHTSIGVKRRDAVTHHGAGVFQACLRLHNSCRPSEATHGLDRLQSVQNVAAWLIFKACCQDHIQPLLRRLHWLQMPECVSFWLAVLVYRCLHGSAPGYLASDLQRVSHLIAHQRLRSSTTSALVAPPHLSSDCCIGLEQFAGVSPVIAVVASFPQQTENRTFCLVLQT